MSTTPASDSFAATKKKDTASHCKRRRVESRDPSHDAIREEMTNSILASIQGTAPVDVGANASEEISLEKLERFVLRAEDILYKSSSSIEAYADQSTLKDRLRSLLQAISHAKTTKSTHGARRQKKTTLSAVRAPNCPRNSLLGLRRLLGNEDYEEALYLVREISKIRKTGFSWMFVNFDRQDGTPRSHSTCVVMDIYHRVPLVDIFHRMTAKSQSSSSTDRLINSMDKDSWTSLISHARNTLRRYRALEDEVLSAANVTKEEARITALATCCGRKGSCPPVMRTMT